MYHTSIDIRFPDRLALGDEGPVYIVSGNTWTAERARLTEHGWVVLTSQLGRFKAHSFHLSPQRGIAEHLKGDGDTGDGLYADQSAARRAAYAASKAAAS